MRVIAAVTLLFLPGTFVATLFSASFWDFSPGNQSSKVSSWVWLYWVVTGALAAAVLCVWRGIPRMKQWSPCGFTVRVGKNQADQIDWLIGSWSFSSIQSNQDQLWSATSLMKCNFNKLVRWFIYLFDHMLYIGCIQGNLMRFLYKVFRSGHTMLSIS